MNKKQLILIVAACAVLGVVGLLVLKSQKGSWKEKTASRERLIPNFPVNDVAQLTVKQGAAEMNLVRKEDQWVVKERADFAGNHSDLIDFLRKLWEMKPGEEMEVGSSQLARLELVAPGKGSGTLVEFKDKSGKTLTSLLLGKKHMKKAPAGAGPMGMGGGDWPDGRYVMVNNDVKTVALLTETFNNLEPKPEQWISKEFIKVEKPRMISVVATNATNSWKISRETESGEWKLADPQKDEQLDSSKASSASSAMSSPSLNDVVLPDAKPEVTGFDKPSVVTIETFDNLTYTLKFGKKTADDNGVYLNLALAFNPPKERAPGKDEKKEDKEKLDKDWKDGIKKIEEKFQKEKAFEKWGYLVSKWSVDSLVKPRSEMLAPKKEEPKKEETTPAPPKVEAPKIEPPKPEEKK